MILRHNIEHIRKVSAAALHTLREMTPGRRSIRQRNEACRSAGLSRLNQFSREANGSAKFQRILVDGQWDNANYWLRYALLRRALTLAGASETGLIGQYNRSRAAAAFGAFGFTATVDHGAHVSQSHRFSREAQLLLDGMREAADILEWKLPEGFPVAIVYDGILKRQRRASVDIDDPSLPLMVAEALSAIANASRVLDQVRPDLLVLSHVIDFSYGALAWIALKQGIPVIALYGDYGTNRFIRMKHPEDVFSYPCRPTAADDADLNSEARTALAQAGQRLLRDRIGGRTADTSAIYAFRRRSAMVDRKTLAECFGWNPAQPVIGVYVPNWFDYPNGSGRFPFRDFRDWAETTLSVACETREVNWLFKAHPCDEWYGRINGPRTADLVAAADRPNIRLCDTAWNGRDILKSVDGIVTVHGTAGIEAPAEETPVLVPYAGWYGPLGFVEFSSSVDDYCQKLRQRWWESRDRLRDAERAALFAGWYFAAPAWHDGWFLHDDASQDAIWWDLETQMRKHEGAIAREVTEIRDWLDDGHPYFPIFKLRRATRFVPAHPYSPVDANSEEDPRRRQLAAGTA